MENYLKELEWELVEKLTIRGERLIFKKNNLFLDYIPEANILSIYEAPNSYTVIYKFNGFIKNNLEFSILCKFLKI